MSEDVKATADKIKTEYLNRVKLTHPKTILQLHKVFNRWYHIDKVDNDFIDVTLASCLDREVQGDPVWLFIVAPPGGLKTEIIRSLSEYPKAYSLDSLTAHTLVSGISKRDSNDELVPAAGLLPEINGKVLLIKDFTTILSSKEEDRSQIFGDLRSIYDGYFEKGFGTLSKPQRIKASIGLIAAVTPIIDKYTKLTNVLGERFLSIRSHPDPFATAKKAFDNLGLEAQMRGEVAEAVSNYFQGLNFQKLPEYSDEQKTKLIDFAYYVTRMRANPLVHYFNGEIMEVELIEPETPTRISKQLKKLGHLLGVLRKHDRIEDSEIDTLRRVVKDSSQPKRQCIMDVFALIRSKYNSYNALTLSDIIGLSKHIHQKTLQNELQIMKILGIIETNNDGFYKIAEDFQQFVNSVYALNGVFSEKGSNLGFFSERTTPDPSTRVCIECRKVIPDVSGKRFSDGWVW